MKRPSTTLQLLAQLVGSVLLACTVLLGVVLGFFT
jgi:hypothetical protein